MVRRVRATLGLLSGTVGRRRVAWLLVLQVLTAIFEGASLVLLVPVIQALGGGSRFSVPGLSLHLTLARAFAMVLIVVILRGVVQWRATVLAVEIRLATIDRLRLALIDDLYRADWTYLSGQRRSDVIANLTTDVERAHNAVAMVLRLFVGSFIMLATGAVALLVAPKAGALALVAAAIIVVLAARSTRNASALGKVMTERMAGFGAALADSLTSARVMRAHGAEQAWSDLVSAEAARVREVRRNFVARSTLVGSVLTVVAVVGVLGLVLIGRSAGLSLAELATLLIVATRLLASSQSLLLAAQTFANDVPALERLSDFRAEVLQHPERVAAELSDEERQRIRVVREGGHRAAGLLELHGVGITYDEGSDPALEGIDLEVAHRGLVTVTGPSGAGKSTLLDIILGLLVPHRGEMLVDGAPVVDLAAWRARVGYVPQQTVLVPGTVWQNMVWSLQPGASLSEEAAWAALETACLADVVRGLPGGLQAPLAELAELSGGEQQRLAIARALVRDPELLILDEATSALDRATEARVLANVLDGRRAVLMVTHRALSENPGTVLRLDRGRQLAD